MLFDTHYSGFYKKTLLFLLVFVGTVFLLERPAAAKEVKKDKEFSFSQTEIISAYDDVMEKIVNMRPLSAANPERGNAKYSDVFFYTLTPKTAVMLQLNLGGTNPTHVKAIGVDDGTQDTRAFIVLNCMSLMAAVTPGWSGDVRGAIAKKLGITGQFPSVGKSETITAMDAGKNLTLTFANNGEQGLTLTIQPE